MSFAFTSPTAFLRPLLATLIAGLSLFKPAPLGAAEPDADAIIEELRPVFEPLIRGDKAMAANQLKQLEGRGGISMSTLALGRHALKAFDQKPGYPSPAEVPKKRWMVYLSDCGWQSATTGYAQPMRNLSRFNSVETLLLRDSEGLQTRGLYAHADSEYVFDLGGDWERLEGKIGLMHNPSEHPDENQPYSYSSVEFVIEVDGEVVYKKRRTGMRAQTLPFRVPVQGGKTLTLKTNQLDDGKAGDHGLWLNLRLRRPRRLSK